MTYEQWMKKVDIILEEKCGLPQYLLPDWLSRDCYESGASPQEGAEDCLEAIGYSNYAE